MTTNQTLLDQLRSQSHVDCDTLDHEVAEALGPFVDCTSNQAIAYGELQKPANEPLIAESIEIGKDFMKQGLFKDDNVTIEQLVVEIMMVKLSSRIVRYLTGFVHIQVNPYYAYSTPQTILSAKRIISLFAHLTPSLPSSRICLKVPSTHAGLVACSHLSSAAATPRIDTLATTLFSIEQAVLAAHSNCTYIAPYINELRVHFQQGYVDESRGFQVARLAQLWYERNGRDTTVLAASLVHVDEVMRLGGVSHVTVSPKLLAELASTPASSSSPFANSGSGSGSGNSQSENPTPLYFTNPTLAPGEVRVLDRDYHHPAGNIATDEAAYRLAYARSGGGKGDNERKLADAIAIFADMQDKMEEMVKVRLG